MYCRCNVALTHSNYYNFGQFITLRGPKMRSLFKYFMKFQDNSGQPNIHKIQAPLKWVHIFKTGHISSYFTKFVSPFNLSNKNLIKS